ncbi:UNVERIFIED_CONTAM: hypothetical protein HDU68_010506 [Siphonaria sp. JEL0065]|nr:hypothetical protein HDU68_010506 [Siphonaria sp. JEL0065]
MRVTGVHNLSIARANLRDYPQRHVSYQICVRGYPPSDANVWVLWKRYSEFLTLDAELRQLFPFAPPPVPLPPKTSLSTVVSVFRLGLCAPPLDSGTVESRRVALENYLVAMLEARDERWRTANVFRAFLGLDGNDCSESIDPASASTATTTSSSTNNASIDMDPDAWIVEVKSVLAECRVIREAVVKKDTLAAQGSTAAMHTTLVQIRNSVKQVTDRVSLLDQVLQSHVHKSTTNESTNTSSRSITSNNRISTSSPSTGRAPKLPFQPLTAAEISKREDLLVSLKEEKDNIVKLLSSSAQFASRALLGAHNSTSSFGSNDSAELLGSQQNGRNGLGRRSTGGNNSGRRAFGAQPKETEHTVGLDNQGIVQLQNNTMQEQDQMLGALSTVIQRQKLIGETMGNELDLQNQMLRELGEDVDRVGGNLKHAQKKVDIVTGGRSKKKQG